MSAQTKPLSSEQIEHWRKRIREDVSSNYHFEMGIALAACGQDDTAIGHFRRAIESRMDFPLASKELHELLIRNRQSAEAEAVRSAALKVNPHYELTAHLAAITFRESRGDLAVAKSAAEAALALAPGLPAALHWQAYLAFVEGGPLPDVMAMPELGDTVQRDSLADRYRVRAIPFLSEQRFGVAAAILDIARCYQADAPEWNARHAVALLCLGRAAEAVELLEQVLGRSGAQEPDLDLLVRANIAAGRLERATDLAEAGMQRVPPDPSALSLLGLCAANRGDWRKCEKIQREAVATHPGDPFAFSNLGLALQGLGRIGEAIEMHRAALAIRQDDQWTLTNLGLALLAANERKAAMQAHRRAMELSKPYLRYNLAQRSWAADELFRIYRDLGAFDEAERRAAGSEA